MRSVYESTPTMVSTPARVTSAGPPESPTQLLCVPSPTTSVSSAPSEPTIVDAWCFSAL